MDESEALLSQVQGGACKQPHRKPLAAYLVPFVTILSISRGITIGARTEVYVDIACRDQAGRYNSSLPSYHPQLSPMNHLSGGTPILPDITTELYEVNLPSSITPPLSFSPSKDCLASPAVQASAAEFQAFALTTNGILSAVTTGFWATASDKYGRTRVMVFLLLGLMFWDLLFAVVSNGQYMVPPQASRFLVVSGAVVEGLMGSWATFFANTNAYISDCSEPGSRASVLSKLGGFYYGGIAIGPVLGSAMLRALDIPMSSKLLSLFYLALLSNSVALVYVTFIIPESLDSEERERLRIGREARMKKRAEYSGSRMVEASRRFYFQYPEQLFHWLQNFFKFLAPLAVLAPKKIGALNPNEATGIRRKSFWRWDWDLTLIGLALWCGYLSMGIYPNKYLFAEHVYGWTPEQLGHYIALLAAFRAFWLILGLPALISAFKPQLPDPTLEPPAEGISFARSTVAARRRAYLLPTIHFDLRVAQLSLLCDTIAFTLTGITSSETAFIVTTGMSSLGGGMYPASQSLALALMDRSVMKEPSSRTSEDEIGSVPVVSDEGRIAIGDSEDEYHEEDIGIGKMFGAISVLQAVGQTILGPLLMGEVYAHTVGFFPRMIYFTGAILLFVSFVSLCLVKPAAKIPLYSGELRNDRQPGDIL